MDWRYHQNRRSYEAFRGEMVKRRRQDLHPYQVKHVRLRISNV